MTLQPSRRWAIGLIAAIGSFLSAATVPGGESEPVGPVISLPGHTGAVMCIAFSPNARFAVTHSGLRGHAVHLWDLAGRKQLQKWANEECEGAAVTWTPDGRLILSGGDGGRGAGTALLQDPLTGKRVGELLTFDRPVRSIALSPDGKRTASADGTGLVCATDLATGKAVYRFEHGQAVNTVAYSADGRLLLTGGDDGAVRLWNLAKDRQELLMGGVPASSAGSRSRRMAVAPIRRRSPGTATPTARSAPGT